MHYMVRGILFCCVCLTVALAPSGVHADFFKYKDDAGSLIITNRFEDVPPQYRKRVKVVWDSDLEAKDPLARRHAAAEEQRAQEEAARRAREEKNTARTPSKKEKTLVYDLDESGRLIRRFE